MGFLDMKNSTDALRNIYAVIKILGKNEIKAGQKY